MGLARRRVGLSLLALSATSGCLLHETGCVTIGHTAIAVHVRDQRTGALIGNADITATIEGSSGPPRPAAYVMDSTTAEITGGGGAYTVTIRKAGYVELTRQVTVEADGKCDVPRKVDLDVALASTSAATRSPDAGVERAARSK